MLELAAAWLIFPATSFAALVGAGVLARRAVGSIPSWMLAPIGFAGLMVVTQLVTAWSAIAPAAVVVAGALAVVGAITVVGALRRGIAYESKVAAGVAAVVFAICALPVVASGQATVSGYGVLGDTVVQLLGADLLVKDGRDLSGLPPSVTRAAAQAYFVDSRYPTGALTTLGALARLSPEGTTWLYQPFLGVVLALLALTLFGLTRQIGVLPGPGAGIAAVAAQPALLYSYYLQGSIKEVSAAVLIALLAWSAAWFVGRGQDWRPRDIVPFALVAAALLAVFGLAAGVWLLPAALAVAAIRARSLVARPKAFAVTVLLAAGILVVGSVQALQGLREYTEVAGSVTTAQEEFGNLLRPLEPRQALGVWLQGDYRLPPAGQLETLTAILTWLVFGAGVLGVVLLLIRRSAPGLLYLGISAAGAVAVVVNGSPWADGKALAIAAPAVVFAALTGLVIAAGSSRVRSAVAIGAGAAIALGVAWSNALAYHDVSLAPRDRLEELAQAGERAGDGALAPEFEEYTKYLLRSDAPQAPLDAFSDLGIAPAEGADPVGRATSAVSRLDHRSLQAFPALVVRRDPLGVPPSSAFQRVWSGRWYEVWKRIDGAPEIVGTLVPASPQSARIACGDVRRLARAVPRGGELVAQPAAPSARVRITRSSPNWPVIADDGTMQIVGPGEARGVVRVPRSGTYRVWIGGRFGRKVRVDIGGERAGSVEYRLNENGGTELAGTVRLRAGTNTVRLTIDGPDLRPGNGMANRLAGPVDLQWADAAAPRQIRVPAARWRSLCDRPLRWVEATAARPRDQAS